MRLINEIRQAKRKNLTHGHQTDVSDGHITRELCVFEEDAGAVPAGPQGAQPSQDPACPLQVVLAVRQSGGEGEAQFASREGKRRQMGHFVPFRILVFQA